MKKKSYKNKKFFMDEIKLLQANSISLQTYAKDKYVKDEIAILPIYLKPSEIYDEFSLPSNPNLNSLIFDYIEKEAYYIPIIYPIEIQLIVSEPNDNIQDIEKKLQEHYWKVLADKAHDLKINAFIAISLLLLGILLYSLYFLFEYAWPNRILFNEIFSVAATFMIWEAVDYGLIQRNAKKVEYFNAAQLALAKIKTIKDIK